MVGWRSGWVKWGPVRVGLVGWGGQVGGVVLVGSGRALSVRSVGAGVSVGGA